MESNYTQPVNLGNPEEHTILDFARIIKSVIGKSACSWILYFLYFSSMNSFKKFE
jgi:nucleoside-diphosphate-sugar epimerase